MTALELTAFALKLIFGTLAFLLIGFLGSSHDRRVAGTMLTFPVLNGIGLLTSPDKDPVAVTDAMMPVIVLNALLCFGFIVTFRWAKRHVGAGDTVLSYGVGLAGGLIWCLVAGLLAPWLAPLLPISFWIAALYLFATAIATVLLWSSSPPRTVARADAAVPFTAFWWARRWRAAFFVGSLVLLLVAAQISDAAWVGRLSALPLVPLCVLAGLAIDDGDSLPSIRDTIFIGPGLAMIFVLPFTLILAHLQTMSGLAYWGPGAIALAAGWGLCILAIRFGVPPLAAALDRQRMP